MTEDAGRNLRRRRLAAGRIGIVLDHSDGIRRVRQSVVRSATTNDATLFELARQTLLLAWTRRIRLRHMSLVCDRLVFPPAQMTLFPEPRKKKQVNLVTVLDQIRDRFGRDAIQVGQNLAA